MQAPSYLTEVTYKRVIRLPEPLRVPEEQLVVPLIPSAEAAEQQQPQTGR
jgi:hypothetical protein